MLPKLLTKLVDPCSEGSECEDLKLPFGVLKSDPLPLLVLPRRDPCEEPVVGRKMELLMLLRAM